jgi:hypothetical protein
MNITTFLDRQWMRFGPGFTGPSRCNQPAPAEVRGKDAMVTGEVAPWLRYEGRQTGPPRLVTVSGIDTTLLTEKLALKTRKRLC